MENKKSNQENTKINDPIFSLKEQEDLFKIDNESNKIFKTMKNYSKYEGIFKIKFILTENLIF
jgi:preprotein translocase subunit SecA